MLTKDPYLRPVIFSGLFIVLLTIIFSPGIFLWAGLGGYVTVRLSKKIAKELVSFVDGILLGLFTGIFSGTFLDILTVLSLKSPENAHIVVKLLEKNWPKGLAIPDLKGMLPAILLTTCIFIAVIAVVFSILGGYIGVLISRKDKKTT